MQFNDIVPRVQALLDDLEGTYATTELIQAHAQQQYELLYNKLYLTDSEFSDEVVELPAVGAGSPDLSAFMKTGQPLATLVNPRSIEWKLPGLDATNYRRADGPLDALRDMVSGIPSLDSWAWMRRNIVLSQFGVALDLRIRGTFLFDPINKGDTEIQIEINAGAVLVYMIALAVAEARGNPGWIQRYEKRAEDAFDDLFIAKVKADQSKTRRVARMSRQTQPRGASPAMGSGSASSPTGSSMAPSFLQVSQNTALNAGYSYLIVQATGGVGGISVSLPTAASSTGMIVTIQKMDNAVGVVAVMTQGGDLLNGGTEYDLANQFQYVTVVSDGTKWTVTSNN